MKKGASIGQVLPERQLNLSFNTPIEFVEKLLTAVRSPTNGNKNRFDILHTVGRKPDGGNIE